MSEQNAPECDSNRCDIDQVIAAEKERIAHHRQNRNAPLDSPYIGLSLSGGGVRSASFALGVLQGLNEFDLLKKFDYLSTVSGGGYIGSSFTWFNHVQTKAGKAWQFPFGSKGIGSRQEGHATPLNYLRQHCNFLNPTVKLNGVALFANFFRNSLLSFSVYFLLITSFFCLLYEFSAFDPLPFLSNTMFASWNGALIAAVGLFTFFSFLTVLYGVATFALSKMSRRDYCFRVSVQKSLGLLILVLVLIVALGTLPLAEILLKKWLFQAGGAMSLVGALGSAYGYRRQQASDKKSVGSGSLLPVVLASTVLTYGLALLAYACTQYLMRDHLWSLADVTLNLFLPSLIMGVFVNTNYFGPGRYYRDRLMEAFMPGDKTIQDNKWRPAVDADRAKLSEMCGVKERGPYHLINCNLILADSDDARFRGRGGDSFILSPLYCGGFATGWFSTQSFLKNKMTLSTAMSISGAALSPNAANNGAGVTRNRVLSFLLSLLNLRLGYYASNPALTGIKKWVMQLSQPNFYFPGLTQGLFGGGLNEKAAYLSLSDGGHFEDCGLYELARRRLDVIMICEAGADADYTLADLANAIERVRVDFGYHIHFPEAHGIEGLLPGSGGSIPGNAEIKLAQRGYAIGDIYYGDTHKGRVVYLQAVLTDKLPPDIFSYRKLNDTFPNEPTTDQFFNEIQLEAYRELGYQLCKGMALAKTPDGAPAHWI